jgi:hypothetical protein
VQFQQLRKRNLKVRLSIISTINVCVRGLWLKVWQLLEQDTRSHSMQQ